MILIEILTIKKEEIVDYFQREVNINIKENTFEARNVASTIAAYLVHNDFTFNKFISFAN